MTYFDAYKLLNQKSHQSIGHNTTIIETSQGISVRFYSKEILLFKSNGTIVIDTDGIRTKTTKDRINSFLGDHHILQKRGVWYWSTGKIFRDGDKINASNNLVRSYKWK